MSELPQAESYVTYTGTLVEVGMLDHGCGIVVDVDGDPLTIVGLDAMEVRAMAGSLYKSVTIRIEVVP